MILIADSGSTKTNWIAIDASGNEVFKSETKGLNPTVFSFDTLKNRIQSNSSLMQINDKVDKIFFYGAGCGTEKPKEVLKQILSSFYIKATIQVFEDTKAAVFSVTNNPAIVCILGTGSNCSYFNGKKVIQKITSLGYILMDEASGNYFGKEILRAFFYKKMPKELANSFFETYHINPEIVKGNLYKKENPNAYLASFMPFAVAHRKNLFIQKMIDKGLRLFVENHILQYKESTELPIHFVGSVAYLLKDEIKNVLSVYNLQVGKIVQHPIDGLVQYHVKKHIENKKI